MRPLVTVINVWTTPVYLQTQLLIAPPPDRVVMPTYRAYLMNPAGKIAWGEWIEAETLEEARRKAHELCDGGHPTVELWKGPQKLDRVECADD